jgi:dephospho-CoA kinase
VAKKSYFDASIKRSIIKLLGEEAYTEKGEINRELIASKIFSNEVLLNQLNKIIHPFVAEQFENWVNEQKSPIVFKEAAILIETGGYKEMDAVIVVVADQEQRIQRVMKRDKVSREQVLSRIKRQWSDEQRIEKSDYIIINEQPERTALQLEECLERIKKRFSHRLIS